MNYRDTQWYRIMSACTHEPKPREVCAGRSRKPVVRCCQACCTAGDAAYTKARKAQLDAMPRCEVEGCKKRGRWVVGSGVNLCGWHKTACERAHNRQMASLPGGMGLFMPVSWDRERVLALATVTP